MNKTHKTNRIMIILTFVLLSSFLATACSATIPELLQVESTATQSVITTVEPVSEGTNIPAVAALQPTESEHRVVAGRK